MFFKSSKGSFQAKCLKNRRTTHTFRQSPSIFKTNFQRKKYPNNKYEWFTIISYYVYLWVNKSPCLLSFFIQKSGKKFFFVGDIYSWKKFNVFINCGAILKFKAENEINEMNCNIIVNKLMKHFKKSLKSIIKNHVMSLFMYFCAYKKTLSHKKRTKDIN